MNMNAIVVNANHSAALKKICGITIVERVVLSIYYAGYKDIRVICDDGNKAIELKKILDANPRENLKIVFDPSPVAGSDVVFHADSAINKEHVLSVIKGQDQPRSINIKIVDEKSVHVAKWALLNSCRKPGEAISSHYYRYISLFFTSYLCETKVTPNQVSFFFLLIGFVGGVLISLPSPILYFIGLICQPLAIVFDCVDGEIARVKYQYTKSGEWLDTVCDNLCTLFFVIGISITNYRLNPTPFDYKLGLVTTVAYLIAIAMMFITLMKFSDSGSLAVINADIRKKGKVANFFAVLLKRNVVTLVFMVLGFFYLTRTLLFLNMAGCIGLMIFSISMMSKLRRSVDDSGADVV